MRVFWNLSWGRPRRSCRRLPRFREKALLNIPALKSSANSVPPSSVGTDLTRRFKTSLTGVGEKSLSGDIASSGKAASARTPDSPRQNQPPLPPPCQGSILTEEGGIASRCVSRLWLKQTLVPHSRLTPDKGGVGGVAFMGFLLRGGCLYPVRGPFSSGIPLGMPDPSKGGGCLTFCESFVGTGTEACPCKETARTFSTIPFRRV